MEPKEERVSKRAWPTVSNAARGKVDEIWLCPMDLGAWVALVSLAKAVSVEWWWRKSGSIGGEWVEGISTENCLSRIWLGRKENKWSWRHKAGSVFSFLGWCDWVWINGDEKKPKEREREGKRDKLKIQDWDGAKGRRRILRSRSRWCQQQRPWIFLYPEKDTASGGSLTVEAYLKVCGKKLIDKIVN